MKRTKNSGIIALNSTQNPEKLQVMQQRLLNIRGTLASVMGFQYNGKRDIYKALGYPREDELDFDYYLAKYKRQDIASAIIDRPANKTWTGTIQLLEKDTIPKDSKLSKEWAYFDRAYGVKMLLKKLDKLSCLGSFALVLFGFSDVKKPEDFKTPVSGNSKLLYLRALSENEVDIMEWETNSSNPRYGKPKFYKIKLIIPGSTELDKELVIHHSRVLHVNTESLESDIYGRPKLEPVVNRLIDIEKILGGDAEMFWRGARPGYTALSQPDYTMGTAEIDALETELDKYEHDLRRFITAQGVDIKALEQQLADPINHLDIQIQAISAQTSIPKRILMGSERGELSSAQDKNEWLSLIKTRQEEEAEPIILIPFIDKCMEHKILTKTEYTVLWEDVFAPSEKDKTEIGKDRAQALKFYSDALYGKELMPPKIAAKYLFGLAPEQVMELIESMDDELNLDIEDGITPEEEARLLEEKNQND